MIEYIGGEIERANDVFVRESVGRNDKMKSRKRQCGDGFSNI